ncbi:MAG: hypothetical protein WA908_01415 [Pontixanthobacter sp.]
MRNILIAVLAPLALLLSGCGLTGGIPDIPASPGEVADRTKLDEQAALTLTLAYTGAAKAAKLAIETGIVNNPNTIRAIGAADRRAYRAVVAVEAAYDAGNATSYANAIEEARRAIGQLLTATPDAAP